MKKTSIETIQKLLESGVCNKEFENKIIDGIEKETKKEDCTNIDAIKLINTLSRQQILFSLHILSTSGNTIEDIQTALIENYVTTLTKIIKYTKNKFKF